MYIYSSAKFYRLSLKHLQQFCQWKKPLVIDVLLQRLPPFQERHESFLSLILFYGMQIDSFAFSLLASIILYLALTTFGKMKFCCALHDSKI